MMQQRASRYREFTPIWASLQQDINYIRREMVTKAELATMMMAKADAGVAEERWKGVWQDIAEIRAEMRQRPIQQQQQQQQQTQNLFQALGCSINGLLVLVGAGSMLTAIAAVIVSVISLLLR